MPPALARPQYCGGSSMTELGYHASHEQFPPSQLLDLVELADEAGFEHALASDHFHPWSARQGESGHVWSWLGAAMARTSLSFGTVNAPGYRYHPAVIAQSAATLRELFPDLFWFAVGSGQLLNEGITGVDWPVKDERNDRLAECARIMRRLWDGEEVTHHGQVTVERATLWTRSDTQPPLVGAALSEETARWLGRAEWVDGMITLATPDHEADAARVEAFREHAPDKDVYLKAQLSWAETEDAALEGAVDQWRTNCVPGSVTQQLRTPAEFDELGAEIGPEQVAENVRVSADIDDHVAWIERDLDIADRVYLHNVNANQADFVDAFAEHVLPSF